MRLYIMYHSFEDVEGDHDRDQGLVDLLVQSGWGCWIQAVG